MCSSLTIFNIIFMIVRLKVKGYDAGEALSLESQGASPSVRVALKPLGHFFAISFAIELVARLDFHRLGSFYSPESGVDL